MTADERILGMALDALAKVSEVSANMKAASAERLEAMAPIVATVPWDKVANLSIGWEVHKIDDNEQIFPTLNVVMKGCLGNLD